MSAPEVVTSHRRYCLLKAYLADRNDEEELFLTWIGKQRAPVFVVYTPEEAVGVLSMQRLP